MSTEKTTTATQPNDHAMSKFKGQAINSNELKTIKGGNDPVPPETGIVIHENVGDL